MTPISPTGIKRSNRRAGFTLHELLVTLMCMVVISGVVLTAIGPALQQARLRAVTSLVIGQLQFARSYAITHHTACGVFFDNTTLGVAVMSASVDAGSGQTTWQPVTTEAGRFHALPAGITIAEVSLTDSAGAVSTTTAMNNVYTPVSLSSAVPVINGSGEEGQLITFSPLGQGEDARIILQDARGGTRTLLVEAITGRCELANTNNVQTTTPPNP